MSSANPVPETFGLTGSDAKETLAKTGRARLLRDAFDRLRASDGFSHARSMAFVTSLIMVQGVIALVGLASALGSGRVSDAIVGMLQEVFPGPAGAVLTDAVKQAHRGRGSEPFAGPDARADRRHRHGDHAAGSDRARDESPRTASSKTVRPCSKYGRAFVLTISAGLLAVDRVHRDDARTRGRARCSTTPPRGMSGTSSRWPLAFALLIGATACIFRWSPRRRQPEWSWLALGALLSVDPGARRHDGVERLLPAQLDVRADVRTAGRVRGALALDPADLDRAPVRGRDRGAARSRTSGGSLRLGGRPRSTEPLRSHRGSDGRVEAGCAVRAAS